jgi:DNA polymerase
MFIGEAPGADENITGRPFVGKAGQLLRTIFYNINLTDYYITNIIKCRPPNNRNPYPDEFNACKHFIYEQLNIVNPKVIIILGGVAANYLLNTNLSVMKMRQQVYDIDNITTYVTYHPAAALYHLDYLKPMKEDLIRIINTKELQ